MSRTTLAFTSWALLLLCDTEHVKLIVGFSATDADEGNEEVCVGSPSKGGDGKSACKDGGDGWDCALSIDQVFTFGSPGWIREGNPTAETLKLPGLRVFNSRTGRWDKKIYADPFAGAERPWFVHPAGFAALRVHPFGAKLMNSTIENRDQPKRLSKVFWIHKTLGDTGYYNSLRHFECSVGPALCGVGNAGQNAGINITMWKLLLEGSYFEAPKQLKATFDEVVIVRDNSGWRKEHSYLLRKDGTCFLTFMGTKSVGSAITDLNDNVEEFCGLGDLHQGFTKQLQSMMQAKGMEDLMKCKFFNNKVCKTRIVLGHSLGGAMSEMFSACVQKNGLKHIPFRRN